MDAPIASLMAKWFCEGYERQAKKEEKEEERAKEKRMMEAGLYITVKEI